MDKRIQCLIETTDLKIQQSNLEIEQILELRENKLIEKSIFKEKMEDVFNRLDELFAIGDYLVKLKSKTSHN